MRENFATAAKTPLAAQLESGHPTKATHECPSTTIPSNREAPAILPGEFAVATAKRYVTGTRYFQTLPELGGFFERET